MISFAVVTPENSQRVQMNDNAGVAPAEEWITASGAKATAYAVFCYAKKHNIAASRVGYAVRPLKENI
jgi:hypothetical protein